MRGSYSVLPLQALNVRVNSAFVGVGAAFGCVEYCAAKGRKSGDSGSLSSGSTFLFIAPERWVLVFSLSPLSSLFSPSPPPPALVDQEEGP